MRLALTLSYDGTAFCGWQSQKGSAASGSPSIQATLQSALAKILGVEFRDGTKPFRMMASGRTDAGVHALNQVVHVELNEISLKMSHSKLLVALNGTLSNNIRVTEVREVDAEFHAQLSAVKKRYAYYFQQGPCSLPHLHKYSLWIYKTLDLTAMQRALDSLKGKHDFKPFQASGGVTKTTIREITEARVEKLPVVFPEGIAPEFFLVRLTLVGNGFLKQMVRGIAGTLLQIGEGRRPSTDMKQILESGDRQLVGPTVHGRGLWLEKVWYPPGALLVDKKTPAV